MALLKKLMAWSCYFCKEKQFPTAIQAYGINNDLSRDWCAK